MVQIAHLGVGPGGVVMVHVVAGTLDLMRAVDLPLPLIRQRKLGTSMTAGPARWP